MKVKLSGKRGMRPARLVVRAMHLHDLLLAQEAAHTGRTSPPQPRPTCAGHIGVDRREVQQGIGRLLTQDQCQLHHTHNAWDRKGVAEKTDEQERASRV